MTVSHRSAAKTLWHILFQCNGSIWSSVLPYCMLNCTFMVIIELLAMHEVKIAFSPTGHGLMTLIISFLVVAKVNLSYDRYMSARHATGHALSSLRELNQSSMTFTSNKDEAARKWRSEVAMRIVDLIDCTIKVIKDEKQSEYLARNENQQSKTGDDPMVHVLALRLHLYKGASVLRPELELLERMRLVDILNEFVLHYRNLIKLASTPLPFPLVQMARTFLFLWTFTIPFILRGVVDEAAVAMIFVFFLTYGFIGLELVAMKLMFPFGDGINDLNVAGMREATLDGMERDLQLFGDNTNDDVGDRRLALRRQKLGSPMPASNTYDGTNKEIQASDGDGQQGQESASSTSNYGFTSSYYAMMNK